MERIIVVVRKAGEKQSVDLEVPAEVAINELSRLIASALKWNVASSGAPIDYSIKAVPPGRILAFNETLVSAECYEGTLLEFFENTTSHPVVADTFKRAEPPTPEVQGPVKGWHKLDLGGVIQSTATSGAPATPVPDQPKKSGKGYSWKEIG